MATRTVRCITRKWPDRPHWEFDARWLGADAVGQWLGVAEGTWLERPGRGFHATADHVVLVPHDGWWLATLYADDLARPVDIYVDITTPAEWDGDEVRCVDLDLDVIRSIEGDVWVDDEDEFAAHQLAYGYPSDVIVAARATCGEVFDQMVVGAAPFDITTARGWIGKLRR